MMVDTESEDLKWVSGLDGRRGHRAVGDAGCDMVDVDFGR